MTKVWLVEARNTEYEFHYTKIICSTYGLAEQKQKEYIEKERISNKGRPEWINTGFDIYEWELDVEKEEK